jgi:hypothetical protein
VRGGVVRGAGGELVDGGGPIVVVVSRTVELATVDVELEGGGGGATIVVVVLGVTTVVVVVLEEGGVVVVG